VAVSGAAFNSTFHRLSKGIDMKQYRPALEPFFMQAFHAAMIGGVMISFLRGPEVH